MPKVFLSAGHGGTDPGAVAYNMEEEDINLNALLACKSELEKHGVTVVCSRTTDENDPVGQEVKEANASGADLAVSFHANAGGGDGFEAYYHTSSAKGKKLAQLGEKHVKALGQNSRGIKSGNHLYFVKNTKMTAVLFESFFVDNDKDNDIGDTIAEQKAFGVAYAKAILEYYGISYKATTTQSATTAQKAPSSTIKVDAAKSRRADYAKTYTVTASELMMRAGAGTDKAIIKALPKGSKVTCYGYYTMNGSTTWLYIKDSAGSVGFCSKTYLK